MLFQHKTGSAEFKPEWDIWSCRFLLTECVRLAYVTGHLPKHLVPWYMLRGSGEEKGGPVPCQLVHLLSQGIA